AKLLIESTLPGDLRSAIERSMGSSVLRFLEQKHALGDQRASSMLPPSPGSDEERTSQVPQADASATDDGAQPVAIDASHVAMPEMQQRPSVPELDESPRTRRHAIVSGDDD